MDHYAVPLVQFHSKAFTEPCCAPGTVPAQEFRDEQGLLPALKKLQAQMEETDRQVSAIDEPRVLGQ